VDLVAEMAVYNPFDFFLEPGAEQFPFQYAEPLAHDLRPYLARMPATPRFKAHGWSASTASRSARSTSWSASTSGCSGEIRYLIRMEPGVQTPEQTLIQGSGSCRDSGWLLVQLLRHLGLAARFVSGYLIQLGPT
jgi:transglutaminase-like putative cysteine protease